LQNNVNCQKLTTQPISYFSWFSRWYL